MNKSKRHKRTPHSLRTSIIAFLLIIAFTVPAFAATIEEQMAANSAAWWIAKKNGDTALQSPSPSAVRPWK